MLYIILQALLRLCTLRVFFKNNIFFTYVLGRTIAYTEVDEGEASAATANPLQTATLKEQS